MPFKALLLIALSEMGRNQGRARVGRVAIRKMSKLGGFYALFGCSYL